MGVYVAMAAVDSAVEVTGSYSVYLKLQAQIHIQNVVQYMHVKYPTDEQLLLL